MTLEEFLTIDELAAHLRVPVHTVRSWRRRRKGPPAVKVGRAVRFRPSDVAAWLADQTEQRPS